MRLNSQSCPHDKSCEVAGCPHHATELKPEVGAYYSAIPACKQRCQATAGWPWMTVVFRVRGSIFLLTFLLFYDTASCADPAKPCRLTLPAITLEWLAQICSDVYTKRAYLCSFDWCITRYRNRKIHLFRFSSGCATLIPWGYSTFTSPILTLHHTEAWEVDWGIVSAFLNIIKF